MYNHFDFNMCLINLVELIETFLMKLMKKYEESLH